MKRTTTTLVALLVAVAFVGAVPFATAAQEGANGTPATDDPANATDVRPGERLSGIVAVQTAEFEGELDERAYGLAVAKAATDDAKADVVSGHLDDVERRLADLDRRARELERAHENGTVSDGQYGAEMATIAAEKRTAERLADRSEAVAGDLPEETLRENGINVTAIRTLKADASELGGHEVREIAWSIAGPNVGERMSGGPPDHAADGNGAPGNGTDRGDRPGGVGPDERHANGTDDD